MINVESGCYKKNTFIGMDPTYPDLKLVTTYLIAWHEVETTRNSNGTMSEAMKRGKRRGEMLMKILS
jgi:hypothetical protein